MHNVVGLVWTSKTQPREQGERQTVVLCFEQQDFTWYSFALDFTTVATAVPLNAEPGEKPACVRRQVHKPEVRLGPYCQRTRLLPVVIRTLHVALALLHAPTHVRVHRNVGRPQQQLAFSQLARHVSVHKLQVVLFAG